MHVDIIVPVHNGAGALGSNIPRLHEHLRRNFPYRWQVVIVDHGSTDGSFWTARKLEEGYSGVLALQTALAGRGRALKRGSQGLGDVFCYLDAVHLPEDLEDIANLARPVAEGACDVAVGYRPAASSWWDGHFASGLYRLELRLALNLAVADPQCPFKAISRRVASEVAPRVRDEFWFFEVELLALAQARGFRLLQVPVAWAGAQNPQAGMSEPLPDLTRRILDLRRRLREESDAAAPRVPSGN